MNGVGAVLRLKSFKHYGQKITPEERAKSKAETEFISAQAGPQPGKHFVVAMLAQIPETMEIDAQFIIGRMKLLGWIKDPYEGPIEDPFEDVPAQPDPKQKHEEATR